MEYLSYDLNSDFIDNFRNTSDENNFITKIIENNKIEIILNHLTCINKNFKNYHYLFIQKFFYKLLYFSENYVIIDDFK